MRIFPAPGSGDIYPEQILGTPYLEIRVEREAAACYGARVGDVPEVIETAIGGENLTATIEGILAISFALTGGNLLL